MKVTVIIPVYNGEKRIIRCLDSLISQTYKDIKVLLINDGSKDRSEEVIRDYIAKKELTNVELISHSNRGVSLTRNRGIELANSEYVAFIDQDDYVFADYFERFVEAAEKNHADIVCGGYQRVSEAGKVLRVVKLENHPWAKFVVVAPWAHIYRTSFLKEHNIGFLKTGIGEDVYFSLMAYSYTDRIVTVDYCGYCWVNNVESVSNSKQKTVNANANPFVLLDALDRDIPKDNHIPREWMEYYLYRYIVWYLVFTVRDTPKEVLSEQYDKLFDWLRARYPAFYKNRNISLLGPKGEPMMIRVCVVLSKILYRLGILRPILKRIAK